MASVAPRPAAPAAAAAAPVASAAPAGSVCGLKLSQKQIARRDAEERSKSAAAAAKKHREETRAQLKMDKHVRKNDENWKAGNAAAMKSGAPMPSLRDRFGEEGGG